MATIKDIARLANVSHGTVSNVLNGKGNVSVEKIRAVESAAKQLGYSLNAQAKQLRNPSALANNIAVIFPNITARKYSELYSAIEAFMAPRGYHLSLYITYDMPYKEYEAVQAAARMRVCGVISVSCHVRDSSIYDIFSRSGAFVVFLERKPARDCTFFSFDYEKIGAEIAHYIVEHGYKRLAFIRNADLFADDLSLENAVVKALRRLEYTFSSHAVKIREAAALSQLFTLHDSSFPHDVIITSNEDIINSIHYIYRVNGESCPAIVALTSFAFPLEDSRFTPYYLNYINLGTAVAEHLYGCLSAEDNTPPHSGCAEEFFCAPNGFHRHFNFPEYIKKRKLNLLLVKGSASSALEKLIPEFERGSGIDVNPMIMPPNEMYDTLDNENADKIFDIFRSNLFMLPIYAKQKFLPLQEEVFADLTKNMIPKLVSEYALLDGIPYGIPFDIGTQILIYRKDLFDDPTIKRMYYEQTGGELNVPASFDEFNQVARFFTRKYNSESPVEYGTSSSLTTTSGICTDFELRFRAFGGKAEVKDGHLVIDKEVARKALQNYIDHFSYSFPNLDDYWGGANVQSFIKGRTAMEILYYNFASDLAELTTSKTDSQIGFASIPGKCPAFIGASLSISHATREPEAALEFLRWACGPELAEAFTYLGGVSPHSHIYDNEKILLTYPGHKLLKQSIPYCAGRGIFNFINDIEYEKLLGILIRNTVNHTLSFDEAYDIFSDSVDKYVL